MAAVDPQPGVEGEKILEPEVSAPVAKSDETKAEGSSRNVDVIMADGDDKEKMLKAAKQSISPVL